MSYKYRVISIQFIDVFAPSEEEACEIAREYYYDELGGDDLGKQLDTVLLPYDFEKGLTSNDLRFIGTHIDDDGVSPFAPVNDPF